LSAVWCLLAPYLEEQPPAVFVDILPMLSNTIFDLQVTQILDFSDLVWMIYSFRGDAASESRHHCVSVGRLAVKAAKAFVACHMFLS
jgi:hypothetical protein